MGSTAVLEGEKRGRLSARSNKQDAPQAAGAAIVRIRAGDIKPNPFCNVARYPLDARKVEALRSSIRATGAWPNVIGRRRSDGCYELAYGHHRLEAVRQERGEETLFPLTIDNLSDQQMLAMMVRENMEERASSALDNQASVRAVVGAYAAGAITLAPPHPKSPRAKLRYAPSFVQGDVPEGAREDRAYAASTLQPILGWSLDKIENTLAELEMIEGGFLRDDHFTCLSPTQGIRLAFHVRRFVRSLMAQAQERDKDARAAKKEAAAATDVRERRDREQQVAILEDAATRARRRALEQAEQIANTLLAYPNLDGFNPTGIKVVLEALHPKPFAPLYEDVRDHVWESRSATLLRFRRAALKMVKEADTVTWTHLQKGVPDRLRDDEHPLVLELVADVRSAFDTLVAELASTPAHTG